MSSFKGGVDLDGLNAMLGALEEDVERAARPAAQAGIQVIYDAVKRNVNALGKKTGNLDRSIYQAFVEKESSPGVAAYEVSWNPRKAPHAFLVENGHIQRYAQYLGKDGKWHTAVRPEMRGKPKPPRRAAQSVKDAYYVLRKGGPVQVPAQSFVRKAASEIPAAQAAAEARFFRELGYDL